MSAGEPRKSWFESRGQIGETLHGLWHSPVGFFFWLLEFLSSANDVIRYPLAAEPPKGYLEPTSGHDAGH